MYVIYSHKTFIGVHEMHGRMRPDKVFVTVLLLDDPLSYQRPTQYPPRNYGQCLGTRLGIIHHHVIII